MRSTVFNYILFPIVCLVFSLCRHFPSRTAADCIEGKPSGTLAGFSINVNSFGPWFPSRVASAGILPILDAQQVSPENSRQQDFEFKRGNDSQPCMGLLKQDPVKAKGSDGKLKTTSTGEAVTGKMAKTRLNLELRGTVIGTGIEPIAVIRIPDKAKDKLYSKGDWVDRAVIQEIYRRQVVLRVDGKREILLMKDRTNNNIAEPAPAAVKTFESSGKGGFREHVTLTLKDLLMLKKNIKSLKKQVRVRPYYYKSKMNGFRVTSIQKNSVFYRKLGLRNGDVISGVNNKTIKSKKDAVEMYQAGKLADITAGIDVQIKRNGKSGELRYSLSL